MTVDELEKLLQKYTHTHTHIDRKRAPNKAAGENGTCCVDSKVDAECVETERSFVCCAMVFGLVSIAVSENLNIRESFLHLRLMLPRNHVCR